MSATYLVFSKKPFDSDGPFENELIYAPDPGQPCAIAFPKDDSVEMQWLPGKLMVVGDTAEWRVFVSHLLQRRPRIDFVAIHPRCFLVEYGGQDPASVHQQVLECLELTFNTTITAREVETMEVDYQD